MNEHCDCCKCKKVFEKHKNAQELNSMIFTELRKNYESSA